MIDLDIETSGIHTDKCGIWQIGAIDLNNIKNYFLQEARIDNEDNVQESALKVTGKREEEIRDRKKQSQKQLIINYLEWLKQIEEKLFLGQNVGWDISFIQNKCMKYELMDKFREVQSQRSFDLHTIAQEKYKEISGKYLTGERGKSEMNLTEILKLCRLPDERISINERGIKKQGKNHNALEDCKLEGECYSRIEYGKNLFPEYSKFPVPKTLRK